MVYKKYNGGVRVSSALKIENGRDIDNCLQFRTQYLILQQKHTAIVVLI